MTQVARLLTCVDLDDEDDDGPSATRMSVKARHEAVLSDGRRIMLLDDRGWGGQLGFYGEWRREDREAVERRGIWANQTRWEMEQSARVAVGPDEPFDDHKWEDMEADHWNALAKDLQCQGIEVTAAELEALPHEVELSERVLARIR
jgi:hypothetical protein